MCPTGDGERRGFGSEAAYIFRAIEERIFWFEKKNVFLLGETVELAQWAKMLDAKLDVVTLSPTTHMMEGEHQLPQIVLQPPLAHHDTLKNTHA